MTGIDRLEALGIAVLAGVVFAGCGQAAPAGGSAAPATARPRPAPPPARIDGRSYNLGVIGAFSEVVSYGIKTLALSEALAPDEMAALRDEAERIAARHGVSLYLEDDLVVTDLFPADVAAGKQVLLIYTGSTKDDYMAIKADKAALEAAGRYEGEARAEIARRFGRLLSYPEKTIAEMLARREP